MRVRPEEAHHHNPVVIIFQSVRLHQPMASVPGTYTYQNHNPQGPHPSTHPNHTAIYVGGQNAFFQDNHMAHYRGWTVVACFDSDDQNWGV